MNRIIHVFLFAAVFCSTAAFAATYGPITTSGNGSNAVATVDGDSDA